MGKDNKKIVIDLLDGVRLVAEQNSTQEFQNEIYIGIESTDGVWYQDLAVVRNAYSVNNDLSIVWNPNVIEVLVYADEHDEDYTNKFSINVIPEGLLHE